MNTPSYPTYFIQELIDRVKDLKTKFSDAYQENTLHTEKLNDCYAESQEFLGSDWFEETQHMQYLLKCTEPECAQYLIDQLNPLLK